MHLTARLHRLEVGYGWSMAHSQWWGVEESCCGGVGGFGGVYVGYVWVCVGYVLVFIRVIRVIRETGDVPRFRVMMMMMTMMMLMMMMV